MTRPSNEFSAAAHFDAKRAATYEARIRRICPSYDALHQLLVWLLQSLPEKANFLVVGAGTGAEIVNLGKRFPGWRFVGVDVSADMLAVCRARVAAEGLAGRVELFNGRLQDFRSDVQFDAASSICVSHFIKGREEKLEYFRAIAAHLKPGGVFVLADAFGDKETAGFKCLMKSWMDSYAAQAFSPEEFARDRANIDQNVDFMPESELMGLLADAGFGPAVRFYQTFLFGGWVMERRA